MLVQSAKLANLACLLQNMQQSMYVIFLWKKTHTELEDLKDKPQCAACGNISANLKNPICNSCVGYYSMSAIEDPAISRELNTGPIPESGNDVPFSILKISGATRLLINNTLTEDLGNLEASTRSALATNIFIHLTN